MASYTLNLFYEPFLALWVVGNKTLHNKNLVSVPIMAYRISPISSELLRIVLISVEIWRRTDIISAIRRGLFFHLDEEKNTFINIINISPK